MPDPRALRLLLVTAAALAAAGCSRSFDNPAGELAAGEVGGKARVPASPADVSVSVKGSLHDQAVRPSARFGLVPLPRGPHTVLLRQGVARAAMRELTMGYGSDGQLEGHWLGDLALPRAVTLAGSLFGPYGTESEEGVVVDEVTGIAQPMSGSFALEALPVGTHRLVVATRDPVGGGTWIGGPVLVTAALSEQGTEKRLADVPLRGSTGGAGHLWFRVASTVRGLAAADAVVHVTDAAGAAVPAGPADSGGDRDLALPEGVYFVEVTPPPALAASVPAPDRRVAVVVADDGFDLGTFILADRDTLDASLRSCHADADCAPGTCAAGVCSGAYAPPDLAPAGAPLCAGLPPCGSPGAACDLPGQLGGAGAGSCATLPSSTLSVCIPCSTRCSADGTDTRAADPCSY